ncbi:MAG TPA: c-type cytochrome domain-containing protein [Planctomycetaceae bacterium]
MLRSRLLAVAVLVSILAVGLRAADAAITPEQRKELAEISKEVGDASKLLRKKQVDEAEQAIDAADERLKALLDAGVPESEKLVGVIQRNIALRRRAIALQRGEKPADLGVSFSDDVAPIIKSRCLTCHGGDDPRGGLRLDTFAGWKQGGASRQPLARVLLPRLTAPNPQQRMPKGEEPLTGLQVETIARWLREGAKFDGKGDDVPIGEKADEADGPDEAPVIVKPEGGETVSFVNDVAPFMVNICGRCHMGNNPRGGFDMTTFEGLMKGGDSGAVIEPGDTESSRLWLMVSNKEQPRMPPGQLLITRRNYEALTTWIKEGAKFDGDDPKKPLRELVPSDGEMRSEELAKLSPGELVAHRRERSEAHWKKAFPKEPSAHVETEQFFVYGNVGEDRLKQTAAWADEQAATLRSMFGAETPLWKGKLAVFLVKDRFGYEEFALAVDGRPQVPPEVHGHVVVTSDSDEAYVVLEDVGDEPSADNPGLKAHLANHLTQAYLLREGDRLPDWAVQGTGLHVAAKSAPDNPYFAALRSGVEESLKAVRMPEQLFADGTFPPAESAAVGYALVEYLIQAGGPAKYAQFLARLAQGTDPTAAIQAVYRTTPAALATAFAQNVSMRRR